MAYPVSALSHLIKRSIDESDDTSSSSSDEDEEAEDDEMVAMFCRMVSVAVDVAEDGMKSMRSFDPEFEIPYSTSALNGPPRMQELLDHQHPQKMQQQYGMTKDAFLHLIQELGLTDGRSVSASEQLSFFLLLVRQSQSLRKIQEQSQRSLRTEAHYFRLVLDRLSDVNGFYGKYVKMPTAQTAPHRKLVEDDRFREFRGCIGAIDGTHLPIV
jgi:hypothetical protein